MTRIGRWMAAGAFAALAMAPAGLRAQTPEEVVQTYFQHLRDGDMRQVAALTHPASLQRFQSTMLGIMSGAGDDSPLDADELAGVSPDSFYVVFMSGAGQGMGGGMGGGLNEMLQDLEVRPVGHVLDGDRAHVVYEAGLTFMGSRATETLAIALRRDGGRWLVDPGEGMMGMMGGGVMYLLMSAGMQAGMLGAMNGMDEDFDEMDLEGLEDLEDLEDVEDDGDEEEWDDEDEDDEDEDDEDEEDDDEEDDDEDDEDEDDPGSL